METISTLAQQLAAAVVGADPDDLQQLAAMHSQFQEMAAAFEELPAEQQRALEGLRTVTGGAETIVEQIILRESDNAAAELGKIGHAVSEIQSLIDRAMNGTAPSGAFVEEPAHILSTSSPATSVEPVVTEVTTPPSSPAVEIIQETTLAADDIPLALEFVAEANGHVESAEAGILSLEEDPGNLETVNSIFRAFHTIKGVAGFLNLKQIGKLAHAGENLLDLARQGKMSLIGGRVDCILEAIDLTKAMLSSIEQSARTGCPIDIETRLPEMIERLHQCAIGGEEVASAPIIEEVETTQETTEPIEETAKPQTTEDAVSENVKSPTAPPAATARQAGSTSDQTVKVATDRLDALINMVGELVIAQAMVQQDIGHLAASSQRASRNLGHVGKITRELQDLSMSMRMVPIQGVFQKMARLVRDTARKMGKEIELTMVGGDTELDRNVVEAIADPLVHMVRNSLDHGIESPEDRIKAGKSRAGRVELKAYHQSGNIVIEITDDGRGLNKQKILSKAIRNGLIKEGAPISDAEIHRLIFSAGLSTAEKVTDISGRGVGMDVVRKNVEALRGRVDITSAEGKGSTFIIRLPLTLAVIDGLVVKVGIQRYIIPITSIEQSIQPKQAQVSTVQGKGEMCMIRGSLLRLVRLHKMFNVKPIHEDPCEALVVIVQNDRDRCCLLVDELLGQQQVVIKSLGDGMGHVRGISGGAILGDGNVSLILDVSSLIALSENGEVAVG